MNAKISLIALTVCLALHASAQNERITFEAPGVYPEGIAFNNKTQTAYVSSVRTGTIGSVDAQGKYKEVFADKGLKSSFGMKVDEKRNHLWVCVGDPNYSVYKDSTTFGKMARVVVIDLATNQKISDTDLSSLFRGRHFLNDITFDDKGNAYVTDSFSPVIYKIDTKGNAILWAQSALFKSKFIGLNGIAYHPAGFILAAQNGDGCVLKIDMKDPRRVQKVKIGTFFPGADGLWVDAEQNLILVQNKGVNKVFKIASTDRWETARVVAATPSTELFQNPTTCGLYKGGIYVLNAKLNELSDSSVRPSDAFSFQRVVFP